jgi:ethanolaminephosphotransferase
MSCDLDLVFMTDVESARRRLNNFLESEQEVSRAGLNAIAQHKYKSGVYTPLDLLFYKIWWTPVASRLPAWLAPNLITFIGFLVTFSNIPLMVYFNPTLETGLPSWVFAYAGLSVFFYVTMDAIDGMQARATKSSSPLGQLFDHGCDCTITTVYSLMMINALNLGPDWRSAALVASVQFAFFLSQWEEKYTGICRTCVMGIFGVTETQLMLMTTMFVSAMYPNMWTWTVYNNWTVSDCYVLFYLGFMVLVSCSCILGIVFKHPRAIVELGSVAGLNLFVLMLSFNGMRPEEYLVVLLALAFNNSFSTTRVIVSSMSHTEFPLYHTQAIPFFVLIFLRILMGYSAGWKLVFVFYLGALLDHVAKALVKTVNEISSYLGIYVFDITRKRT